MRKLLSLATIFTLLVAVAFVFNTNNNSQQKADHSFEVEENPTRGIAGAMQYLYAKKANQITGEIDVNDVLKAQAMLGEPKDYKDPNTVEWEKMGPINVGGRTRALVIDKDNPNRLYTGGVSGGIYISDNGGLDWYEYAGNATLPNMSITSMVQAANGDLYVGTGEGFAITFSGTDGNGSSGAIGTGIYKSTDDGATFELLSETVPNPNTTGDDWAWVNDMTAHPTNANVIYAANKGGLYVTENGGDTWDLTTYGDNFDLLGVGYDITIAGNGTVHANVGSHYYRSTSTTTFDRLSGNALGQFPIGGGRKRIAVAPSDDNYVYAIVLQNNNCLDKVLQSTDGGDSWIEIAEGGSDFFAPMFNGSYCQGGYDLAFGV
ncbi:MAG: two-component regulator propeller domain-containing protein, partial [Chitinophagales bacterium]